MKQPTDNNNLAKFAKWSKICIVTTIITFSVFGVGSFLLTILKKFTDFEEKAPFLYDKVFVGILLAFFLAITLEIFCCIKARKYKKLIEKNESKENDDETNER